MENLAMALAKDRKTLAEKTGIAAKLILEWVNLSDLSGGWRRVF